MVPTVLLSSGGQAATLCMAYINSYNADDTGTGSGRTPSPGSMTNFRRDWYQRWMCQRLVILWSGAILAAERALSWEAGWATNTRLLSSGGLFDRNDIFNYAVTLAFPWVKQGNLLGFVVGSRKSLIQLSLPPTRYRW